MSDFAHMFVVVRFSGRGVGQCSFLAAVYRSRQDQAVRGHVRDASGQGLLFRSTVLGGSTAQRFGFKGSLLPRPMTPPVLLSLVALT